MRVLTVILLFSFGCFAQAKYYAYFPLRTYHFDRSELTQNWFHDTEGGNLGVIVTRQSTEKVIFSEVSFGAIRNSYGALSVVMMGGVGVRIWILDISAMGGLASGYKIAYEQANMWRNQDNILSRNGILPQSALTVSSNKGFKLYKNMEVSPMFIVSPIFVNGGLKITLN